MGRFRDPSPICRRRMNYCSLDVSSGRKVLPRIKVGLAFRAILVAGALLFVGNMSSLRADQYGYQIGNLRIEHPRIKMPVRRESQASLFMVIHNNGSVPDKLLDVKSDTFGKAVLHTGSKQILTPHGIMIPAHATVILEPDRPFVALEKINANRVGSDYELRLNFEKSGEATIKVAVEPTDAGGRDKGAANDTTKAHTNKSAAAPASSIADPGDVSVSGMK